MEPVRRWARWLEERPLALSCLALLIAAVASLAMARVVGFNAVGGAIGSHPPRLGGASDRRQARRLRRLCRRPPRNPLAPTGPADPGGQDLGRRRLRGRCDVARRRLRHGSPGDARRGGEPAAGDRAGPQPWRSRVGHARTGRVDIRADAAGLPPSGEPPVGARRPTRLCVRCSGGLVVPAATWREGPCQACVRHDRRGARAASRAVGPIRFETGLRGSV